MKKAKRQAAIRLDENRPSKPSAPPASHAETDEPAIQVPTYRGPSKTEKVEAKRSRAGSVKPPVDPAALRRPRRAKQIDYDDQQLRRSGTSRTSGPEREQYIRLRIRDNNGRLSVIDSHLVDGPLAQETGFPAGNAYEVTLDDRLLHAGALPDLGTQRSFSNPDGPPEQRGHYLTERSVYEFTARLPASEVTPETIGRIALRLHRVKAEAQADRVGPLPLAKQFEREMRPIAELVGLPDSALPEAIEKRGGRTPNV